VDAEVVHDDDVRVGELADQPGLALEARVELRVVTQLGVDDLDGDRAAENDVGSPVNLGHAAAAAEFVELVAAADNRAGRERNHFGVGGESGCGGGTNDDGVVESGAVVRAESDFGPELFPARRADGHGRASVVARRARPQSSYCT